MLKWALYIFLAITATLAALFYWLLLSSSTAPKTADGVFDIDVWRVLANSLEGDKPTEVRILEIGHDVAPSFAVQAGDFHGSVEMSYNAVQIVFPDYTIMVGGAIDLATSEEMRQSEAEWGFDPAAHAQMIDALLSADKVLMTHEHLDHVMAIARHPNPDALAPRLMLNAPQIADLPLFADGDLAPVLANLQPRLSGQVEAIAPGVVVIPAPGHTAGSQLVFIKLDSGENILLIGDIVWSIGALDALKTRPVLTQFIVFDPNEDRKAIKAQVRALHDLMVDDPSLIVIPAHDRDHLIELTQQGPVKWGLPD